MSFIVFHRPVPHTVYSMTAVIGNDGQLYWFLTDVYRILGYPRQRPIPHRQVKDVVSSLLRPSLQERRILSHDLTVRLLVQQPDSAIQAFGCMLNDPRARVLWTIPHNLEDYGNPTKVYLSTSGNTHWFVWYEFFKQRVMARLHHDVACDVNTFKDYVDRQN